MVANIPRLFADLRPAGRLTDDSEVRVPNDDDDKRSDERDENDTDGESEGSEADEATAAGEESGEPAGSDDDDAESSGGESTAAPAASTAAKPAAGGEGKRMSAGARLAAAKAAKAVAKASKKAEIKAARDAASGAPKPSEPEAVEASTEPLAELNESELGRAALRAGKWWESNQQLGWIALAAAAIAIVGFLGWKYHADTQSVAAGALLAEAVEISGAPIEAEDTDEAEAEETDDSGDAEADEERSFPTTTARDEAALAAYQQVVSQFPDHPSAGVARLGVARALLALGRHDEAREAYQEAFDRNGREGHIAWQALEGMAFAQEAAGQAADAQATYDRLANLDDHAFEPIARYHLARLMMNRGERDEARTALRELVDSLRADTVAESTEPRFPYVLAQAEARLRELDPSSSTSASPSLLQPGAGGGLQVGGGEGGDIDPAQLQELIRQMQARQGEGGGEGGGE